MMNEQANDPIERLLREDARRAIPDQGFSVRVALALPGAPRPWR